MAQMDVRRTGVQAQLDFQHSSGENLLFQFLLSDDLHRSLSDHVHGFFDVHTISSSLFLFFFNKKSPHPVKRMKTDAPWYHLDLSSASPQKNLSGTFIP